MSSFWEYIKIYSVSLKVLEIHNSSVIQRMKIL